MALSDSEDHVIVRTNCATIDEAAAIAKAAVTAGLAACGNIHRPIVSIYRWEGELVQATEHLLELKTTYGAVAGLEGLIRAQHSYDLPAILVLPIEGGETRYLAWISDEAAGRPLVVETTAS